MKRLWEREFKSNALHFGIQAARKFAGRLVPPPPTTKQTIRPVKREQAIALPVLPEAFPCGHWHALWRGCCLSLAPRARPPGSLLPLLAKCNYFLASLARPLSLRTCVGSSLLPAPRQSSHTRRHDPSLSANRSVVCGQNTPHSSPTPPYVTIGANNIHDPSRLRKVRVD